MDIPTAVLVSGTNCFVAGFLSSSISVFDIHEPAHPSLVTEMIDRNRLYGAYDMKLVGTKLYVTARLSNRVTIYDVSNAASPQFVGQIADRTVDPASPFTRLQNANGVEVIGNLAYIVSGPWSGISDSLTIADVSNPAAPVKLSEVAGASQVSGSPFTLLHTAWAVQVVGHTAFVTGSLGGGLTAVDVSDPRNPRLLAQWANGTNGLTKLSGTEGMAVHGNILYVLDSSLGAINLFNLQSQLGLNVTGYVGIGTVSPKTALDVAGVISAQALNVAGPVQSGGAGTFGSLFSQSSLYVDAANANAGAVIPGVVFGSGGKQGIASKRTPGGNQSGLDFYTQGSPRISIAKNGHVGIGTTTPGVPLDVDSGSGLETARFQSSSPLGTWVHIWNTSVGGDFWSLISTGSENGEGAGKLLIKPSGNGSTTMTIQANGSVGLGTSTPGDRLDVNGTIRSTGYRCRPGTGGAANAVNVFNFQWTGSQLQAWVNGAFVGTVQFISDRRLKEDIKPISTDALARVAALKPASFKYRNVGDGVFTGDGATKEGFVADEMQVVIPSAVEGDQNATTSDGQIQPQTVNPLPVIAVLTKAVQELNAKVESADREPDSRIKKLEMENAELKARLEKLERLIAARAKVGL